MIWHEGEFNFTSQPEVYRETSAQEPLTHAEVMADYAYLKTATVPPVMALGIKPECQRRKRGQPAASRLRCCRTGSA